MQVRYEYRVGIDTHRPGRLAREYDTTTFASVGTPSAVLALRTGSESNTNSTQEREREECRRRAKRVSREAAAQRSKWTGAGRWEVGGLGPSRDT